ncbi:hypothetical protein HPP92_015663 [Vanilla planifolia]|uniref:Uncharacterized protein n=1 Tax=Vanilla planifolia TaxID=51239 RepID=A0A835QNT2_VANPL|nr:hypothetical protein HPP92_015663 [Vanilla planifolia]
MVILKCFRRFPAYAVPEANIHGVRDVEERSSRNFRLRSCFVYTVVWVPSALDLDFHTEALVVWWVFEVGVENETKWWLVLERSWGRLGEDIVGDDNIESVEISAKTSPDLCHPAGRPNLFLMPFKHFTARHIPRFITTERLVRIFAKAAINLGKSTITNQTYSVDLDGRRGNSSSGGNNSCGQLGLGKTSAGRLGHGNQSKIFSLTERGSVFIFGEQTVNKMNMGTGAYPWNNEGKMKYLQPLATFLYGSQFKGVEHLITSKSMPVINSKKILGQEYIYLSFALAPLGSEYRKLIEGSIVDKI